MIKKVNTLAGRSICFAAVVGCSLSAQATIIDFTGGTVHRNDGSTATTNNSARFDNVAWYEESGFKYELIFSGTPTPFSSIVGDYYGTGNDVIHTHWADGPFGEVSEIRVSKVDGTSFDLGGFRVSTNTSRGGGPATGGEIVWINSSKASNVFTIEPDDWGLGAGPDPLINISSANALFNDISWFSFTNDLTSTAVGFGLDNFFLDELGDPDGVDPTVSVPEPGTLALLSLGLLGLVTQRRTR